MLKYKIDIPLDVNSVMDEDYYIIDNVNAFYLSALSQPVKFSAFASVFLKRGNCDVDINLKPCHLEGPCVLNIKPDQIIQKQAVSEDVDIACLVLSRNLMESVGLVLRSAGTYSPGQTADILPMTPEGATALHNLYQYITSISRLKGHPYTRQSILHAVLSYFYSYASLTDESSIGVSTHTKGRIANTFISLVQEHFKQERFLDFYAEKMSITSKHLSRTVKQQTGLTAVEWIERFVILEAQAMLKSSTMTIQQIADHLNFPSQSFFGKYFKKNTGLSPKDYRNS